jgi:hypothetical protein
MIWCGLNAHERAFVFVWHMGIACLSDNTHTSFFLSKTLPSAPPVESSFLGEAAPVPGSNPPLQGPCKGDSGGPLVFNTRAPDDPVGAGKPRDDRLAGLTSWGVDCGFDLTAQPGIFTRLTTYADWLNCLVKSKGMKRGGGGVVGCCCAPLQVLLWRDTG